MSSDGEVLDSVTEGFDVRDIIRLSIEAGEAIMEVYREEDVGVEVKSDNSPVTRADIAAHNIIEAGLEKLTPEIPLLSEESGELSYETRKGWSRYWLVDPLDGTKEFIHKRSEFTVNIALIDKGEPVFGVVYVPVQEVIYYGTAGKGAMKVGTDGTVTELSVKGYSLGERPSLVVSKSHRGEALEAFISSLGDINIKDFGSSLKLCVVAEGDADLYPKFGPTMEWDTAAAQAVVEAAGGRVTDHSGERLRYNKEDLHNPDFMVFGNPHFPWEDYL